MNRIHKISISILILLDITFGIFAETIEERLKEGEIIVEHFKKGDIEGVKILAIIDAPIEFVWKVITDYDNFEKFMPHVEEYKILGKKGNNVYTEARVKIIGFTVIYRLKYTHTITKDKMIDCWEKARDEYEYKGKNPVELKKNYGCWTLERHEGNKTKSTYVPHTEFQVSGGVPEYLINKISNLLLKISAPGVIKATRERVEEIESTR